MSLIHPADVNDSTVSGEEHSASISLIIDESEPGQGPRLHRHAYDETWVIQEGNISFQGRRRLLEKPARATSPSSCPAPRTSSPTTALADRESSASTPAQGSRANGLNNRAT